MSHHHHPWPFCHLKVHCVEAGLKPSGWWSLTLLSQSEDWLSYLGQNFFLTSKTFCNITLHAHKPNDFFNHLSPVSIAGEHSFLTNCVVYDWVHDKACHLSVNFFFCLTEWCLSRCWAWNKRPCKYFITDICHLLDRQMLIYAPFLHMIYQHFSWMT